MFECMVFMNSYLRWPMMFAGEREPSQEGTSSRSRKTEQFEGVARLQRHCLASLCSHE